MNIEAALVLADDLIFTQTGKHLSDLQATIIRQIYQGQKYFEIAQVYSCTEGHVKDVASVLWKVLSKALGEKVNKSNLKSVLARKLIAPSLEIVSTLPITSTSFIGRHSEIIHINDLIQQRHKIIVIQGEGGIGKTTLAQQYLQQQDFELVLELLMAKETANITSVESVVEEWLKKDFNEEPGREFGISLLRLKRHLENQRLGILIDNFEPALNAQGMIIDYHRGYVELLRVLADAKVKCVTLITSRDRFCEPDLNLHHYRLRGLDLSAWGEYFRTTSLSSDASTLQEIHFTYGGNPKAMEILAGVIKTDFAGNMQQYWQENQGDPLTEMDLKNLVASQFNRLQILDEKAYQLLCRLGCYRYQDVPTIPLGGLLALLWDVEPRMRKQAIASLCHRSLIEYHQGQYWLHPVIRAEAIIRLRSTDQWQKANSHAAEFWTESVNTIITLQDALMAWEAYYHYLDIQDFEQASLIILKPRKNQWEQFLPLGSTLYRMGLLQAVLTAIPQVIPHLQSSHYRSELSNILGDLCWITGKIHEAISHQQEAIIIATQGLAVIEAKPENSRLIYYLKMLEVDSLLSIGLYHIDLGEFLEASVFLNRVIQLAQNTSHYRWAQKATICLALVQSCLGSQENAKLLADKIYSNKQLLEHSGRNAYFMQVLAQTYVNLGEFSQATELLEGAITVSQQSHYPQILAKAFMTQAEIHRKQNSLHLALDIQLEAIQILEDIGAKCDLAEGYYQLALIQQQMGDNNQENFQKAILLFTEIKAPKQVEKVILLCDQ